MLLLNIPLFWICNPFSFRLAEGTLDQSGGAENLRGDRVLTLGQVRADDEAMFRLFFLLAPACFFFVSCQQSVIHPESTVVVKDVRIPSEMPWYSRFASHSFVDYRETPSSPWRRLEIANKSSGIVHEEISSEEAEATERWGNPIHLVSQSKTDGVKVARQMETIAKTYDDSLYRPWLGPNSNTLTQRIMREVEGVSGTLEHNGVGKDYGFYFGPTSSGTGLEVHATYLGLGMGLKEGVEVNLMGLTAGVGIWQPSIKIPFLLEVSFWSKIAAGESQ